MSEYLNLLLKGSLKNNDKTGLLVHFLGLDFDYMEFHNNQNMHQSNRLWYNRNVKFNQIPSFSDNSISLSAGQNIFKIFTSEHNKKREKNHTFCEVQKHNGTYNKQAISEDTAQYKADWIEGPIREDKHIRNNQQSQVEKLTEIVNQLVIKNKLNSKNAFQIPLIDVSTLEIINNYDDQSWSKISNVLENSSKVYSFRVDFMTDLIRKITTNMARNQKAQEINLIQSKKQQSDCSRIEVPDVSINVDFNNMGSFEAEMYNFFLEEPHKLNQFVSEEYEYSHKNVRRMFDQNGLSGLLLANLQIGPNLYLDVDYNKGQKVRQISERQANFTFNLNMKDDKNWAEVKILEEVEWFRSSIFEKDSAEKQFLREDCYNLNMNDEIFNEDAYCNNEETNFQQEHQDCIQINEKADLLQQNYGTNDLYSHSLVFGQLCKGKKKMKQRKKKKDDKMNQCREKSRVKVQPSRVDFFSQKIIDKICVWGESESNKKKRKQRKKEQSGDLLDKNVFQIIIPVVNFQLFTHYVQFKGEQQEQVPHVVDDEAKIQDSIGILNLYESLKSCTNSQPFSTQMYSMHSQAESLRRPPKIKTIKKWVWKYVRGEQKSDLLSLHELYQKQKGGISEALIFLSLLHLGNQKNLQLEELNSGNIQIINQNRQTQ